jgi:hypothetical protein
MDKALTDLAAAVIYEIGMLAELPAFVADLDASGPAVLKNACLEATLLHARGLIEFLYGRPCKDGTRAHNQKDVSAEDYLRSWHPRVPPNVDEWLVRIDVHLSHLSQERAGLAGTERWQVTEIVRTLVNGLDEFAVSLEADGSPHAATFRSAVRQALGALAGPSTTVAASTGSTSEPDFVVWKLES